MASANAAVTTSVSAPSTTTNSSPAISTAIAISIVVIFIIYVIVMYELFINHEFIFAPFTPPVPSTPHFYPLGNVTPLSQEQIEHRNAIIRASAGTAP